MICLTDILASINYSLPVLRVTFLVRCWQGRERRCCVIVVVVVSGDVCPDGCEDPGSGCFCRWCCSCCWSLLLVVVAQAMFPAASLNLSFVQSSQFYRCRMCSLWISFSSFLGASKSNTTKAYGRFVVVVIVLGYPLAPWHAGKICRESVASWHALMLAIIVYN